MNLDTVRQRLASLNKPKGSGNGEKREKIDMSLYLWKPKAEGKYQIRIVSSKLDKENPFKEVFLHYGYAKFPIYALTNWGEKDPIVELAKTLKQGDYIKENWQLSNKLQPKMRIFVPIIVRGEEDKGVRLWEFGKEVYNQLLQLAEDEDYGDYTDVSEGRDFTLNAVKNTDLNGREGLKSTLTIKPKTSVLSNDPEQVEKWLNEQPDILEIQKTFKKTFEQLKEILTKFLTPEGEEEEESKNEEVSENSNKEFLDEMNSTNSEEPEETAKKKAAPKKTSYSTPKGKSKGKKFDDLFKEEETK
jgi:hypothetical protein